MWLKCNLYSILIGHLSSINSFLLSIFIFILFNSMFYRYKNRDPTSMHSFICNLYQAKSHKIPHKFECHVRLIQTILICCMLYTAYCIFIDYNIMCCVHFNYRRFLCKLTHCSRHWVYSCSYYKLSFIIIFHFCFIALSQSVFFLWAHSPLKCVSFES